VKLRNRLFFNKHEKDLSIEDKMHMNSIALGVRIKIELLRINNKIFAFFFVK